MPLSPGARLGSYEVVGPLGAGGMGEVFRARDERLHRFVALKVLPAGMEHDAEARRRLRAEARLAAAIDHPYICKIYEVGEAEGRTFISMELIAGRTLRATLDETRPTTTALLRLATEMAEALEHAHRHGLVHRDLKPSNVMVADGHVKVLDFGLARLDAWTETANTRTQTSPGTDPGTTKGTLAYMAPEQPARRRRRRPQRCLRVRDHPL